MSIQNGDSGNGMRGLQHRKTAVPKVVVVGGGFAGIAAVQSLRRLDVPCEITLISKTDMFEYYPALYKLVTGALAIEVSVPLSTIFSRPLRISPHRFKLMVGTLAAVDPGRQVVTLDGGAEYPYDYLVLALGSQTNYFGIKGLPELSLSFKSVKEAFRLKRHFCELFAAAETMPKQDAVAKLHTVIVGGGPSGVELAGDLTHYLRDLAREYKLDPSLVTIDLIEAANRVLPTLPEKISKKADKRLRMLGVNIYTNRAVMEQDLDEVLMGSMSFKSNTVIWTAGTQINDAYKTLPGAVLTDRKRVQVNEYLAVPNDNHVFVVGDGAGTQYSGLAQTAIRDGAYIGEHLARLICGEQPVPYKPKPVSFVIPIGNYWALFAVGKRVFTGLFPWLLRSAVDFRYFFSILPPGYVFSVFRQGAKYRRSKTYCPTE